MYYFTTKRLKPETAEDTKLASTPAGMRELLRVHSIYHPLLNATFRLGDMQGMSTLDIMTVIAFNALIQTEEIHKAFCEHTAKCGYVEPMVVKIHKSIPIVPESFE